MPRARVGVIGWNYPEWRGPFYPPHAKPADLLRHYAARYPIVEAASSGYGLPKADAVAAWATATPDGFEMSLKVPQWILRRRGAELARGLDALLARVAPLQEAGRLGVLVLQQHPGYRRDDHAEDLDALLRALPQGPRWGLELRHASWWRESTYDALREADVALVWSDLGATRTPPVATSDALYLRLFGERDLPPPYDRARRDAGSTLAWWAERVQDAPSHVRDARVLVSKHLEGYAPGTADRMRALLGLDASATTGARQTTLDV